MEETPEQSDLNQTPDQAPQPQPSGKGLRIGLIIGNILLIAGAGLCLYRVHLLSLHPPIAYIAPHIAPELAATPSPAPVSDIRTYTSAAMGVTFAYPAQWDVTEDDTAEKNIEITSPDIIFPVTDSESGTKTVVGNIIVDVGVNAMYFSQGSQVVDASLSIPKVLPGSSSKTRFISFFGDKNATGPASFGAAGDTGSRSMKSGQSVTDLPDLLAHTYTKYTILAAYKQKDLICQSLPCRSAVPLSSYKNPTFTQALEIMKTVSFQL